MKNEKSGQRGSIIYPMIFALAIAVLSIQYYISEALVLRRLNDSIFLIRLNAKVVVQNVVSILSDQRSFWTTVNLTENGDLVKCLTDPEFVCTSITPQPLSLKTVDGAYSLDGTSSEGFTYAFKTCTSYPSAFCPIRYDLTWAADCAGKPSCKSPDIYVYGDLKMASQVGSSKINLSTYKLNYRLR